MDISRLADLLKNKASSAAEDYAQLANAYPNLKNFAGSLVGNIERNVPTQAELENPDYMQQRALNYMSPMAGTLGTVKNLNAGLIEKYLQEGKLSPEEMAQYEVNALAMETPNLQKYNVENAEAQIPDSIKRAKSLGFLTQPSKEQYHLTRREWESNTPDLTMSDMGFHTGTLEQAQKRGKALSLREFPFNEQSIIPITPNKYSYLLKLKDQGTFHADGLAAQLEKKGILSKGEAKKIQNAIDADMNLRESYDSQIRDVLKQNDIDAIKYANEHEGAGDSYAYINPSVIRSRFAAFDPLRKASPSLLAGGALGSLLLNEEMNKGK